MSETGQKPRKISVAAARAGHSASSAALDTGAIRRAIENSQEFGSGTSAQTQKKAPAPAPKSAARPVKAAAPLFSQERMFYDQDRDPAFAPQQPQRKRSRAKRRSGHKGDLIFLLLTLLFSAALLISGGVLVKRYLDDRKTQDDFAALQDLMPTPQPAAADETAPVDNTDRFAALQAQNSECVGWISIDYTDLSYPVMYSPTRPNFYLKHDFQGEYSDYGVPYLDEDCTLTAEGCSNNLIIYGHNMKTGIIFRPLVGYLQKDFYTVHPRLRLDTLYDSAEYEVFAAFEIDVVQEPDFVYNEYHDMDEETFDWFVAEVKRRSPVDSGITPVYGDQLLTLSTCEYTTANGRMVVCARRVADTAEGA